MTADSAPEFRRKATSIASIVGPKQRKNHRNVCHFDRFHAFVAAWQTFAAGAHWLLFERTVQPSLLPPCLHFANFLQLDKR